jgi:hypothetical protein
MTEETPRKRARFADPNSSEPGPATLTTPTKAAKSFATQNFASLPSATKSLVNHYFDKFIKLKTKERQQALTLKKFTNDTYIPKSAHVKLELNGSTRVKEKQEYKTLATEVQNMVTTFQKEATKAIKTAAALEMQETASEITVLFCNAMLDLANIALISISPTKDTNKDAWILALSTIKNHPTLLQHVNVEDFDTFVKDYHEHTPKVTGTEPGKFARITTIEKTAIIYQAQDFPETIRTLFVKSWEAQLKVYQDQERRLATETYVKGRLESKATKATAEAMDLEKTIDAATMDSLIEKKITEKTKGLQTKVDRLTEQLRRSRNVKNKPRGASPDSASQKKKKKKSSTTTSPPPGTNKTADTPGKKRKKASKKKGSADAKNNGSTSSNKKASSDKSKRKKPPSKQGSSSKRKK